MSPDELSVPRPGVSRKLAWVVVSIMTALIVLALVGVVWGFMRQYRIYMAGKGQAAPASQASSSVAVPAVLTLAPGVHIVSVDTEAGKLVLHLRGPQGAAVEIIDLSSGKLTGLVKEAP